MRFWLIMLAAFLPICTAKAVAKPVAKTKQVNGCNAYASELWKTGKKNHLIEAYANGPKCSQSIVTIVIRKQSGEPIWYEATTIEGNMVLAENLNSNAAAMSKTLKAWISVSNPQQTTYSLPDWKASEEYPVAQEFPFYPDSQIDRNKYIELRNAKLPMFCFVTGMESETCLVLEKDGTITNIGVQSFPG